MKRWWQFWKEDPPDATFIPVVSATVPERNWCYYDYVGRSPIDSESLAMEREGYPIDRGRPIDTHDGRNLVLNEMHFDRVFAPGRRRGIDYPPVIETWEREQPKQRGYEG